MNILLVDDDIYVFETLRKTLDWGALGIENVYSAPSVNRARKIIEDIPIHIIICDIEMPKENGFALLQWIRDKEYIVKEILLTSYAEFRYASEAIKYGCYAYALKPIDFAEMERMIVGAVKAEKKALSLVNHDKYLEYWTASQKYRKEEYFRNLLINENGADAMAPEPDYQEEQMFLPMLIRYSPKMKQSLDLYERGMFDWTVNNTLTEVLTTADHVVEAVLHIQQELFLVIIRIVDKAARISVINSARDIFLKKLSKKFDYNFSLIIGMESTLSGIKNDIADLFEYLKSILIESGGVTVLDSYHVRSISCREPDYVIWEGLLRDGQAKAAKAVIDRYLDQQLEIKCLDRKSLRIIVMNFIQIVVSVLKENHIRTYQMDTNLFSLELINYSVLNVTNAKTGLHHMIDTATGLMQGKDEDNSIIKNIKEYIDQNLDEVLTRESLAKQVYLNPDYLARIFKKEIGDSIGSYITSKRVEVAKDYLVNTEESVNAIAVRVGYDNFSYFTKVFKDRTGMTPKEYRQRTDYSRSESNIR